MPRFFPFLAREIIYFHRISLFKYVNGDARTLGGLVVRFNPALSRSLIGSQVIPGLDLCGSKPTFEARLPSIKECVTSSGEREKHPLWPGPCPDPAQRALSSDIPGPCLLRLPLTLIPTSSRRGLLFQGQTPGRGGSHSPSQGAGGGGEGEVARA